MKKKIAKKILEYNNIILLCHIKPDGDTIGSALSLYYALVQKGKNIRIYCDDKMPDILKFLKNSDVVNKYNPNDKVDADCIISLDSSSKGQLGTSADLLYSDVFTINIDHHDTNNEYADLNYVVSASAANCENIYDILLEMDINFTCDMATALYTGISTDTGNFLFPNTSARTHEIASKLIDLGADKDLVSEEVYRKIKKRKQLLIGRAINNMQFFNNDEFVIVPVFVKDLEALNCTKEDTEGLINIPMKIDTVKAAALIFENADDTCKVSIRTKGDLDCAEYAHSRKGGGHKRASGYFSENKIDKEIELIKEWFQSL